MEEHLSVILIFSWKRRVLKFLDDPNSLPILLLHFFYFVPYSVSVLCSGWDLWKDKVALRSDKLLLEVTSPGMKLFIKNNQVSLITGTFTCCLFIFLSDDNSAKSASFSSSEFSLFFSFTRSQVDLFSFNNELAALK